MLVGGFFLRIRAGRKRQPSCSTCYFLFLATVTRLTPCQISLKHSTVKPQSHGRGLDASSTMAQAHYRIEVQHRMKPHSNRHFPTMQLGDCCEHNSLQQLATFKQIISNNMLEHFLVDVISYYPWRIHVCYIYIYGNIWIPSIYPLYVSIYIPAPWILWVMFHWFPLCLAVFMAPPCCRCEIWRPCWKRSFPRLEKK